MANIYLDRAREIQCQTRPLVYPAKPHVLRVFMLTVRAVAVVYRIHADAPVARLRALQANTYPVLVMARSGMT